MHAYSTYQKKKLFAQNYVSEQSANLVEYGIHNFIKNIFKIYNSFCAVTVASTMSMKIIVQMHNFT